MRSPVLLILELAYYLAGKVMDPLYNLLNEDDEQAN